MTISRLTVAFWLLASMVHAWPALAAEAEQAAVSLPPGETRLSDLGVYRVVWQSYDKEPVAMPPSWTGHFDSQSGISYHAAGRVLGRQAFLMHSPWLVPPGKVWVDYSLLVPAGEPVRLSFGIAMSPEAAKPNKSDGVTFSCYAVEGGQSRELMREHYAKAQWQDYSFDLAPYAGKTVTVRLQVEPGPTNNSAFDFSLFGDAKITVGGDKDHRGEFLRQVLSSRAYQATAKCSRTQLSNTPKNGITPSNLLPYKNGLEQSGDSWRFSYEGEDCRLVYSYTPTSGTLDDFRVQLDDGPPIQPAAGGGVTAVVQRDGKPQEVFARGGKSVRVARENDALNVLWEYDVEGTPLRIDWSYRILGKALVVSARCDQPSVSRFSLGDVGPVPFRKAIDVPYMVGHLACLRDPNLFVCRYLDWTQSHASQYPQGEATYEPKTDGTRNPLIEIGYVAVSHDVGEVLPNIPHPASPYLSVLGPRVMLDIWGHYRGTYEGDAENLRRLKDNGVDHVAIISHDWQCYGYDVKLPDHLPANAGYGGDAAMVAFGKAANECGYLWSLHENYIDLYPDAPSYDPAARVLTADGSPSKAWYNEGTKVQSYGLKCNRALGYARQNAPEIHKRFATTAAYLDVHTCVPPWHQLDHQADQPMAAQALAKVKHDTELFQFMRDTHGGPLFGEGYCHFYWAGRCDGVEAQVNGGEDHLPLVDFDLLKIHPQMVNHGMGYYERWFRHGYQSRWGRDTGSMEQIDKYRAQEVAYGHAGFIGAAQTGNLQWIAREHHLMHAVQRLYGTAKPVEICYEVDGQLVTASAALLVGDTSRQRIRYDSGLSVWVNWREEPWSVEGRVLPQWGFLALGPDTEVSTVLRDGKLADYAECPEYVFADARTYFEANYLRPSKDIEPRLASFEYLGGNRIRVTYEWIVNDTLDGDYHCFVHGLSATDTTGAIEFQQDHDPPKPTSQWRKGMRVVDGPYEFEVSPKLDTYQLGIGLHKGSRVPLKGAENTDDRLAIARLSLQRQGDRVTNITAEPLPRPKVEKETDFAAHLNPPETWVEFGSVATDGAVKINREKDRLVLFPYPRDKSFRVSLNLKTLAPDADRSRVKVHALAAGTCQNLGPVDFQWENDRLMITLGKPGAGRYLVTWK